jgi:phospholipid/cholesterol/gamma-HCH transport system substrate-binding protein
METRARYIIVGFFTVAVVVAGFLFVYWLHGSAAGKTQNFYRIRFEAPAVGLRPGVAVLFNGVRVGEVTRVQFDYQNPSGLLAEIAVDPATPVRQDTRVGIDSQGLVGAATVSLTGGSSTVNVAPGPDGEAPLLIAKASDSENLLHAAKVALAELEGILSDNAQPLHEVIGNVGTFAATLSKNSGRIDNILVGLERMTGGGEPKAPPTSYGLGIPDFPAAGDTQPKALETQVGVPEPTALVVYETQKLLEAPSPDALRPMEVGQWEDSLPKIVQAQIVRSFEKAGFTHVAKTSDGFTADVQVQMDIRAFAVSLATPSEARVEISATLLGSDNKIQAKRTFTAAIPAKGSDSPAAAAALNEAFGKVARDLVIWARDTI